MIQGHYIDCALYFYYYFISSPSEHQALDPGTIPFTPSVEKLSSTKLLLGITKVGDSWYKIFFYRV